MSNEADLTFTDAVEGEGTRMRKIDATAYSGGKLQEIGAILRVSPLNRTGENASPQPVSLLCGPFSEGLLASPVSKTPPSERKAITSR